ncbi:ABC-type sugar transport system substrate-binding protein [Kaistia hirudinis]|uniref:ABC-type sugar transport system substrate-binding protein n=1 Tax=Kaistia hirudinis TaxID=1293440 RepID=A0A840ALM5_9HYPH|nr:substrate-binding domain-containing protein [Kaistia hirudinis]MBB3930144.1 ABC-type sugar transport system substrate-binding protein [Kaistia hirudinis]
MNRRELMLASAALALAASFATPTFAADRQIAGIVFQQDQFFNGIESGMKAAAKKAGVELLLANSDSKPEKEQQLVDTYVTRGVKAIVISPISPKGSEQALRRASEAGVKVITYNTFNLDWDFVAANLSSNQADLGRTTGEAAAKFIKEKLGGKAKIATLGFRALGAEVSDLRTNSFLEAAKAGGNEITVVAQQDGWLAEKAVAVAGDLITANPEIDILYGANEGGTVGSVQAVRNAGKQGKIFVFGIDGSEQLANFLLDKDDVLQATTAQQPFKMGSEALDAAVAILDGKEVSKSADVAVLGLSRTDPAAVEAFKKEWKSLK